MNLGPAGAIGAEREAMRLRVSPAAAQLLPAGLVSPFSWGWNRLAACAAPPGARLMGQG